MSESKSRRSKVEECLGALAAATLLASGASAAGRTVEATSTSVLTARPEIRAGEAFGALPLIELLSLSATGFEAPYAEDVRVRVSAWGELRPVELPGRGSAAGDVDLAFAQASLLDRRVRLALGRQLVFGGVSRAAHLDGALAELRLWKGLKLSAYGGATVKPRFAVRRGDAITGGRLSFSPSWTSEVGASYVFLLDRGLTARSDLGVDGRWAPLSSLDLAGQALWSLYERRLAEIDLGPRVRPMEGLELSAFYRQTSPDLFLPRSSIFSVFAEQARQELGAGALYEPLPRLALYGDWRGVRAEGERGVDVGLRASYRLGAAGQTLLSAQLRRLALAKEGYARGRVSASHRFPSALSLTADLDGFLLDQPVKGERRSVAALATASYPFAPEWLATLSLGAGSTPTFQSRFELLAKVVYRFSSTTRESSR